MTEKGKEKEKKRENAGKDGINVKSHVFTLQMFYKFLRGSMNMPEPSVFISHPSLKVVYKAF